MSGVALGVEHGEDDDCVWPGHEVYSVHNLLPRNGAFGIATVCIEAPVKFGGLDGRQRRLMALVSDAFPEGLSQVDAFAQRQSLGRLEQVRIHANERKRRRSPSQALAKAKKS